MVLWLKKVIAAAVELSCRLMRRKAFVHNVL
jgi:hypothetical protein